MSPNTNPDASPNTCPKVSMAPPIVFQIYYANTHLEFLDARFIPYNNEGDHSPLLEFNVFKKIHQSNELTKGPLWGALSWKFTQKVGLTSADLLQFIATNPGYDLYYCNPFPEFEALYQNLWAQGETAHPDFIKLNRQVFEILGLPHNVLLEEIQPARAFSATNSFIGSEAFWKAYIPFVDNLVDRLLTNADKALLDQLHSSKADFRGVHAGASYLPFIIERFLGVFITSEQGRHLRTIKYPVAATSKPVGSHLKHLVEMKDAACKTRSVWMASCWLNYRNLYLTQRHGRQWAAKYLPAITPKKILFSNHKLD